VTAPESSHADVAYPHPEPGRTDEVRVHDLKTWPDLYAEVESGRKTVDVRKDDRGFDVGHTLVLREYDPSTESYTGRWTLRLVTHVLRGWGVQEGYVAMSITDRLTALDPPENVECQVLIIPACGHRRHVAATAPMTAAERAVEKAKACPECWSHPRQSVDLDLSGWTHHDECDWSPDGAVVPCLGEPDCTSGNAEEAHRG
jgi:hypothetical protein